MTYAHYSLTHSSIHSSTRGGVTETNKSPSVLWFGPGGWVELSLLEEGGERISKDTDDVMHMMWWRTATWGRRFSLTAPSKVMYFLQWQTLPLTLTFNIYLLSVNYVVCIPKWRRSTAHLYYPMPHWTLIIACLFGRVSGSSLKLTRGSFLHTAHLAVPENQRGGHGYKVTEIVNG